MDALKDLQKSMEMIGTSSAAAFGSVLTPDVMKLMSPEQKKMIDTAKNAFNLEGTTPEAKLEELTKTMKNVTNFNK